jgi:teichuronic acid biosynthesis glycosyltransferase TuaC
MNILTISSLYPNNKDPKHGIFVETRLRHLVKDFPEIKPTVIAPVPWFPFSSKKFGEYAKYAGVVKQETRNGIEVHHPTYLVIPKIGMYLTPLFMSWAISKTLKKLTKNGKQFNLIDGHYFYPDGVAIAKVAKKYKIPFTCTARGTDINLIPQYPTALKMIKKVFKQASHMMTVCQALKDEMIVLGADENKVTTLRNGVDLDLFSPSNEAEQQTLKDEFGIQNKLVMSVGWLIERKGHYLVIDAIKNIDNSTLAIAGDGPDLTQLKNQVNKLGLENRVKFLGAITQPELNKWFQAADVTVLASSREGWANVLLESMASGTPVVATKVWGTPEVVTCEEAGVLVERNAHDIQQGLEVLLTNSPERALTRKYAEQFDWQSTSKGQLNIFKKIASIT